MSLFLDKQIAGLRYMLIDEEPFGTSLKICAIIHSYFVKFVCDYDEARD